MEHDTVLTLDKVSSKLKECRNIIDTYLYYSNQNVSDKDRNYCRKVYDSICKTLDLL